MPRLVQSAAETMTEAEWKKSYKREYMKRFRRKNKDRLKIYRARGKAKKLGLPVPDLPPRKRPVATTMTIRGLFRLFGLPTNSYLENDPEHVAWYEDVLANAAAANKSVLQYLKDTTWHEHFGHYFCPELGGPRPHDPDELRRERLRELDRLREDAAWYKKTVTGTRFDPGKYPYYANFQSRINELEAVLAGDPVAAVEPDKPVFPTVVDEEEFRD